MDDPDVFALDVLNSELNGFGGRLFNEVVMTSVERVQEICGCTQRMYMVVWS